MRLWLKTLVIGLIMGAAEVVPGVSGGTIAFISGIYERLINAVRQFTPWLLVSVWRDGVKSAWTRVDGTFLVVLFGGMGISILVFAGGVGFLLRHEPIAIWSFFTGLVLASTWIVYRQISRFGIDLLLAMAVGAAVGIVVTGLVPLAIEPTPVTLFFGGMVAVCAWILPGLSGSFVLLVLGLYTVVIDAIERLDVITLASLGAGCAVGLVSFAQLLSRLLHRFRDETLAVLTGFMVGSLVKLWPWKLTVRYQIRSDGSQLPLVQEPLMPGAYSAMTGNDADMLVAIVAAIGGFALVLLIDFLAKVVPRDA